MQDPRKRELLETYLKQQQANQQTTGRVEQALVHAPDNMSLEEFKHQVKMWLELDNQVKKMNEVLKEKKAVQKILTEKILSFMARYNIEDLNTKDGKLRYKVTQVKPTVKQTAIKKKLQDFFDYDKELASKVMKAVFEGPEEKVEKPSLRRLKGVNIMSV